MEHLERLVKLESRQESIEEIARKIEAGQNNMVEEFKKINQLLAKQVINDEKLTSMVSVVELKLTSMIKTNQKSIESAHKRIDDQDKTKDWFIKVIGAFIVLGVLGAVISFKAVKG